MCQNCYILRANPSMYRLSVSDNAPGRAKHTASVTINSLVNQQSIVVNCLILTQLTSYAPRQNVTAGRWHHVCHLLLVDNKLHSYRPINMILGADVYGNITRDELLRFPKEPIAQNAIFG